MFVRRRGGDARFSLSRFASQPLIGRPFAGLPRGLVQLSVRFQYLDLKRLNRRKWLMLVSRGSLFPPSPRAQRSGGGERFSSSEEGERRRWSVALVV